MNLRLYLLVAVGSLCMISCSSASKETSGNAQVAIDNNYKTTKDGELIIDGKDIEGKEAAVITAKNRYQDVPRLATDSSQISTMLDGFGNKVQTRTFYNDPLIKAVILRTSAKGLRKVFVYAVTGEVKGLPDSMLVDERVMTLSSRQLAEAANITRGREDIKQAPEPDAAPQVAAAKAPVPAVTDGTREGTETPATEIPVEPAERPVQTAVGPKVRKKVSDQ